MGRHHGAWGLCWSLLMPILVSSLTVPLHRLHPPLPASSIRPTIRQDLLSKCQEKWRNTTLDHFTFGKRDKAVPDTFLQRFFLCDTYWQPDSDGHSGPIFFYFGNEADVELYLNNTGLMWETAHDVGALLVFAEHRYYGQSRPFPPKLIRSNMHYLTAEQAMADYAGLIMELRDQLPGAKDSAVIGFGGSYGGMLGSWFRMKYPHLCDGVIAASAPIWSFLGEVPELDPAYFAKGVTFDASPGGGSAPGCAPNVRAGWKTLAELGASQEGRATIHSSMRLCPAAKLDKPEDVVELRNWLASAWDYMSMGNFPYPSGYILNGRGQLPAFPVRLACEALKVQGLGPADLLAGMAAAAGIYYNYSKALSCFDFRAGVNPESAEDADFWGYQYCTEMFQPFGKDGVTDMFWPEPFDADAASDACQKQWGVTPRRLWATQEWGGRRIETHTNIVFSNGLLDPWHGGGVIREVADTIIALIIPEGACHLDLMFWHPDDPQPVLEVQFKSQTPPRQFMQGAHHLDLMFSHPDDPQSVLEVRQKEVQWIKKWIQLANQRSSCRRSSSTASSDRAHGRCGGTAEPTPAPSAASLLGRVWALLGRWGRRGWRAAGGGPSAMLQA